MIFFFFLREAIISIWNAKIVLNDKSHNFCGPLRVSEYTIWIMCKFSSLQYHLCAMTWARVSLKSILNNANDVPLPPHSTQQDSICINSRKLTINVG